MARLGLPRDASLLCNVTKNNFDELQSEDKLLYSAVRENCCALDVIE